MCSASTSRERQIYFFLPAGPLISAFWYRSVLHNPPRSRDVSTHTVDFSRSTSDYMLVEKRRQTWGLSTVLDPRKLVVENYHLNPRLLLVHVFPINILGPAAKTLLDITPSPSASGTTKGRLRLPRSQLRIMTIVTQENSIQLTAKKAGLISFPGITEESARTASELLQRDNNENNGFSSTRGTNSVPCDSVNTTDLTCLLRIYCMTRSLSSSGIFLTLPEPCRPRSFSFL